MVYKTYRIFELETRGQRHWPRRRESKPKKDPSTPGSLWHSLTRNHA